MKVVCAGCERLGNVVALPDKEPQGDAISRGVCDEHVLVVLAEARRAMPDARSVDRRPSQLRAAMHSSVVARSDAFSDAFDGGRDARGRVMSRLLLIVPRAEPRKFTYLNHMYGSETVEVIVDRRVSQRRQHGGLTTTERRRANRRRRDLTEDLVNFGWALVRR